MHLCQIQPIKTLPKSRYASVPQCLGGGSRVLSFCFGYEQPDTARLYTNENANAVQIQASVQTQASVRKRPRLCIARTSFYPSHKVSPLEMFPMPTVYLFFILNLTLPSHQQDKPKRQIQESENTNAQPTNQPIPMTPAQAIKNQSTHLYRTKWIHLITQGESLFGVLFATSLS